MEKLYDAQGNELPISAKSIYSGKKFSILGDSISTYAGYIPEENLVFYTGSNCGVKSVDDTWWMKLINAFEAELCINNSFSGGRVTNTRDETSGGYLRCENLGDNPDVIIIYLGINDFNHEVALGTYNGSGDFPTDASTFREAYAIMLQKTLSKYKNAEVWVATLPYCERNGGYTFPEKNQSDVLLNEFNNAIRELADLFGVKVLEHSKCGMTYFNFSEYMGDYDAANDTTVGAGLHPNAAGHSLIANNDIRQMDSGVRTRY